VRGPTAPPPSSWLWGASTVPPQAGDRSRRCSASPSLLAPALRARRTASTASSGRGWTCRAQSTEAAQARRGSAAAPGPPRGRLALQAPRGGAHAEPRRPAGQPADAPRHGALRPMPARAMRLGTVPWARGAGAWSPRSARGRARRPQGLQPQPPARGTSGVGTNVPRGGHRPGAAGRGGQRRGPSRRRGRRCAGLLVTQRTGRLVRQARPWVRRGGAWALGLRWHGWGGQPRLRPRDRHHDDEP
jgi:hypothetical protein